MPSNKNILTFSLYIFRKTVGFQVFRGHLGGIFRHFYQKPPNRGQPPKIGGNVAGMVQVGQATCFSSSQIIIDDKHDIARTGHRQPMWAMSMVTVEDRTGGILAAP